MLLAHTVLPVLFHPGGWHWAQGYHICRASPQLCQETAMPCSRVNSRGKSRADLDSVNPTSPPKALWVSKPGPLANISPTNVCVGFCVTFPHHHTPANIQSLEGLLSHTESLQPYWSPCLAARGTEWMQSPSPVQTWLYSHHRLHRPVTWPWKGRTPLLLDGAEGRGCATVNKFLVLKL